MCPPLWRYCNDGVRSQGVDAGQSLGGMLISVVTAGVNVDNEPVVNHPPPQVRRQAGSDESGDQLLGVSGAVEPASLDRPTPRVDPLGRPVGRYGFSSGD